jgi:protein-disulfide isomerase
MKDAFTNMASVALTIGALVIAGVAVHREFFSSPGIAPSRLTAVREVHGWEQLAHGASLGAPNTPFHIVEFADFECPFCALVSDTLRQLVRQHPGQLSIVFRHFPLESIHPHALLAALASECALAQGRFEAYHDQLFRSQDSLGKLAWETIARRAGISDVFEFERCLKSERYRSVVEDAIRAGESVGVGGTPTFVFEGKLIMGADGVDSLRRWVSQYVDGK